jgi:hypothetical protein
VDGTTTECCFVQDLNGFIGLDDAGDGASECSGGEEVA